MTSSSVNPVLAVARVIAARSPLGRDIAALSPQVTHISRASQETAAAWSDLVTGNFWQKALFRAYLERIVEGWLFLHMEARLSWGPNDTSDVLLRQASEPSGVALPTSVAETRTEPYYVEKNLGPESASHSSSAKPVWQVVYEARHSHRQVFRIARTVQNPHFLSIILGLQPEEEAALSNLEAVATRTWELARLLMTAEDKVDMEHLANRVERSFTAPRFPFQRGRPSSGPPRQEVLAELQHAVAIGRGQELPGPETSSPSPDSEDNNELRDVNKHISPDANKRERARNFDFAAFNTVLAAKPFSFPLQEEELDRMIITIGAGSKSAQEIEVTNIILLAPDAILHLGSLDEQFTGPDGSGGIFKRIDKGIALLASVQEPFLDKNLTYPYGLAPFTSLNKRISLRLKYQGMVIGIGQPKDHLGRWFAYGWRFERPPHRSGYTLEFS